MLPLVPPHAPPVRALQHQHVSAPAALTSTAYHTYGAEPDLVYSHKLGAAETVLKPWKEVTL